MDKICACCKVPKPYEEFRPNKSKKDGYQAYCLICDKLKQSEWYQKNKDKHILKTSKRNSINRKENQEYILAYLKNNPCIICGEPDPVVLEFDHIKDKKCGVSKLISSYSLKWVKEEIEKCQVLCANCHKRKTAKDFGWYKLD